MTWTADVSVIGLCMTTAGNAEAEVTVRASDRDASAVTRFSFKPDDKAGRQIETRAALARCLLHLRLSVGEDEDMGDVARRLWAAVDVREQAA